MAARTVRIIKQVAITAGTFIALAVASSQAVAAQAEARIMATAFVVSAENTTDMHLASSQVASDVATAAAVEQAGPGVRVSEQVGAAVITAWMASEAEKASTFDAEMSGPWAHLDIRTEPADVRVLVEFAAN